MSDRLREALDDAMIVAAILRGDEATARLANRLDISIHKALNLATTEPALAEDGERREAIANDRTWHSGYAAGRAAASRSATTDDVVR